MYSREDIFFITGEMKSGTTWLMHLLDAYPGVTCRGEDQFGTLMQGMADLLTQYNQLMDRERQQYSSAAKASLFAQDDLPALTKAAVQRLVFKDVAEDEIAGSKYRSLFEHIDTFRAMFPAAKFIHIVRDPRDIAVSYHQFSANFMTEETRGRLGSIADSSKGIAESWVRTTKIIRQAKQQNPDGVFEIRYEDLRADPAAVFANVLTYLGVAAEEGAVAAAVDQASFKKLSGGRSEGEEDSKSFYRKGVVGDWREKLDDAALQVFEGEEIKSLMGEAGYS